MSKLCILFVLCFFPASLFSQVVEEWHDGEVVLKKTAISPKQSVVEDYIGLYQHYISGSKGSQCAMYPSCSNYGLTVFKEKPFFEAMSLTADRLIRCSHDHKYYDKTYAYGKLSLLDLPPYKEVPRELIYKPTQQLYADNTERQDSSKMFVAYLINQNNYQLALLEIERAIFHKQYCDSSYYLNKLLCYDALNEEEKGILDYEISFPPEIKENEDVLLKIAKLYYEIENYDSSLKTLVEYTPVSTENSYKNLVLQGVINTRLRRLDEAKTNFVQSSTFGSSDISLNNIQLIDNLSKAKMKNPILASTLSIIPGAGYVYTKNYQNAVTSLLINSLLAYATYTSIKRDNYGMAILTGIFSASFYIGNILGSGNSAKRYNAHIIDQGVGKLNINNHINNF